MDLIGNCQNKYRAEYVHAWPVFTFVKEGRDGEQKIINDINGYFGKMGK